MLFLLPLFTAFCVSVEYKQNNVKNICSSTLFGLLAGIVYSFIGVFFYSSYYLAKYSFWTNWFYFAFIEMIVPATIATVFYVLLTKKYNNMFKNLFYVFLGFFSIFMPVRIISSNQAYHYFLLFFKPLLLLCALFYFKKMIFVLYERKDITIKAIAPFVVYMLALLLVPAAIETCWFIGLSSWIWILSSLLYFSGAIVWKVISVKKTRLCE
ncbi:MAG TPA: hypothetical protein VFC68_00730 [Treponemataceae bacterium]|nr:hypothetical protein [Treponemataceae bacterium]